MIDFVTLSRHASNVEALERSIAAWLNGSRHAWNLLALDGNRHDLFSGYNLGASQGKGDLLAFVHDDVEFLGNALTVDRPLALLEAISTGFIGVAGSRLLPSNACWWQGNTQQEGRGMVIHLGAGEFGWHCNVWPAPFGLFGRIAVLDGLLLICHRSTWERLGGFDAVSYRGFHFYDIDITFRACLAGLANFVVPIPLLHKSGGARRTRLAGELRGLPSAVRQLPALRAAAGANAEFVVARPADTVHSETCRALREQPFREAALLLASRMLQISSADMPRSSMSRLSAASSSAWRIFDQ